MQNRYKYKDVSAATYKRNKKKRDTQIYGNEFKDDMRFGANLGGYGVSP